MDGFVTLVMGVFTAVPSVEETGAFSTEASCLSSHTTFSPYGFHSAFHVGSRGDGGGNAASHHAHDTTVSHLLTPIECSESTSNSFAWISHAENLDRPTPRVVVTPLEMHL